MTSTVFVDQVTPVPATWLNDVNATAYTTVPALATMVASKANSGANTDITSLNGPALGAATATTPGGGDNDTSVATTAFVQGELASQAVKLTGAQTIAGVKTFSSSPVVPTPATADNSGNAASTAYARANDIGVDQTWQNMTTTPGRSINTSYTNSTGKPIAVMAYIVNNSTSTVVNATVGAATFPAGYVASGTSNYVVAFIVPSGLSYSISATGPTIPNWYELR